MSRPLFPSVIIAALAFAGHVRPRFMDDRPELTEALLISRAGKAVAKPSNSCGCRGGSRRQSLPDAACVTRPDPDALSAGTRGTIGAMSKVLIVDDQPSIRVALKLLCEL